MPAALTALLIVVIGLLVGSPSPTPALGPDAPARQFSAARATPHVAAIAKAPRPTGSAAHAEARAYLLDRLAELGIPATVHTGSVATTFGVSDTGGDARYAGARVHNVVARVPGADSTRPVALVTHYDSTPAGPGANDAGVPVAVLLETARALAEGPAHRNDLLLVFTDAEEAGLLGAKALVADPDALPPDAVVVNVEARGGGGPTIPFETGPDSGWLIGLLAEHAPHPQAGSVVTEAYRFMPNLTDFTVLREHGHSGLNLTYLRELTRYHGANDTADSVDPDTVQHQGETVLALARALVSADLRTPPVGDSAHFTAFGRVVHHDTTLVVPLAVLAVLGTALALAGAGWRDTARGALLALLHPVLAVALTLAATPLFTAGHDEFALYGDLTDHTTAFGVLLVLTALLGAALSALARPLVAPRHHALGALVLWTALAVATALAFPGASYPFTWTALGGAASALLLRARRTALTEVLAAALVATPVAVTVLPLVLLLPDALGFGLAAAATALLALALPLLPQAWPAPQPRVTIAVAAAALVAVTATGVAAAPEPAQEHRPDHLYVRDADTATATWLSATAGRGDRPPDGPGYAEADGADDLFPGWTWPFRRAPAPDLPLPAPVVDTRRDGDRVTITARSARGAHELAFFVTGARVLDHSLDGARSDVPDSDDPGPWELWVRSAPPEGVELTLTLAPGRGRVVVLDRTSGTPPELDPDQGRQGPPAIGAPTASDATCVRTSEDLP